MDTSAESFDTALDGGETSETELYTDSGEQELYDPGYDANEYETELMDFSYEADDPSTYEADTETHYNEDGDPVDDILPMWQLKVSYCVATTIMTQANGQ